MTLTTVATMAASPLRLWYQPIARHYHALPTPGQGKTLPVIPMPLFMMVVVVSSSHYGPQHVFLRVIPLSFLPLILMQPKRVTAIVR